MLEPGKPSAKTRPKRPPVWIWLVVLLLAIWLRELWGGAGAVQQLPYSRFEELLEQGQVSSVRVGPDVIQGELKAPLEEGGPTRFSTNRVDPELAANLEQRGVEFSGEVQSPFLGVLMAWVLPLLLFGVVWIFLLRRSAAGGGLGGGYMAIGKSKAKVYVETDTKVTFEDVAGVDEAKEELREIIAFLKDPKSYGRLGARVPKGVLLVGPPGTGKTLLAKAVAGEAGVPFFSISGSEFVEMFVGVGAARVRDLFEQARAQAPAIVFIDELDALGRVRGAVQISGQDEREQTLNQLLAEIDGFDSSAGVVLLSATNRPEILDPALLRAGRFDRQILVDRPDKVGRVQILAVHMRKVKLAADVDPERVAALTPGFAGADLANLVNEAALLATRRKADAVTMEDFGAAVERIVAGLEKKSRVLSAKERAVVAHHELGHALVAMSLPGSDPVHKVSIIPRGIGALGYTISRPTEDRFLMTREELENKMAVLLGGRAAETLVFGQLSTGAADDLAKVTEIARGMAMRFGMVEALGNVTYEQERPLFLDVPRLPGGRDYSEETARQIDAAVREIVQRAFERALEVLGRERALLEEGAQLLLERETLGEEELGALRARLRGGA